VPSGPFVTGQVALFNNGHQHNRRALSEPPLHRIAKRDHRFLFSAAGVNGVVRMPNKGKESS